MTWAAHNKLKFQISTHWFNQTHRHDGKFWYYVVFEWFILSRSINDFSICRKQNMLICTIVITFYVNDLIWVVALIICPELLIIVWRVVWPPFDLCYLLPVLHSMHLLKKIGLVGFRRGDNYHQLQWSTNFR